MSTNWAQVHSVYGFLGDQLKCASEAVLSAPRGAYLIADFLSEDTFQILKTKLRREHFFETFLENMIDLVTARAMHDRQIRMVTNAGALDPRGCAEMLAARLGEYGIPLRVAAVVGDNLTDRIDTLGPLPDLHTGEPLPPALKKRLTAVATYIGAERAAQALADGADIVIAGRMTDAGLSLAAAAHAHAWSFDGNVDLLAAGVLAGHLLSCGAQSARPVSLADVDVDALGRIIYPWARISAEGDVIVGSPSGITPEAVITQLFYGISQPQFIDADVVLDLTSVRVVPESPTSVRVSGFRGLPRPEKLRVLALCSGEAHTMRGTLELPRSDLEVCGKDGLRRLIASRMRAGGALMDDDDIELEILGESAHTAMVFYSIRFAQKLYANIARGQLPSLLVSGINGAYGTMPQVEREVVIWDSLIDRELLGANLRVEMIDPDHGGHDDC